MSDHPPRSVARRVLTPSLQAELGDDEDILYWAQPIRLALGLGVPMIFALGPIFGTAGFMAAEEFFRRGLTEVKGVSSVLSAVFALGGLILFAVGVFFLCFPFLSFNAMRRTHVLVTSKRVLKIVLPTSRAAKKGKPSKVTTWSPMRCDGVKVVRRRGKSATLVLSETTEERRSDGRMVYRWEALHGLPRATEAASAVDWMRQNAFHEVHSSV